MLRRPAPPLATLALVAVVFGVFALELAGGDPEGTCLRFGLTPSSPTVGAALASLLLHASWAHLLGNAVTLLAAGWLVERELGSARLLALFLLGGLGGAACHVLVDPTGPTLVGASGGICAVLAAAALLRPSTVGFVATFVAYNIACLLLGAGGSVSVGCHVGGFVAGTAMMASVFWGELAVVRGWRRARVARAAAAG